jgi:hypothetical protein
MTKRIRFVLLLITLGMAGVLLTVFRPQAEEVEDSEAPAVSEADLQLYIKVYSAMQENHDLTIDSALAPYNMPLDDFRQLERRIQNQPRMVERVRQALLDQAKAHSVFAQALGSPTPAPGHPEHKRRHGKKK